MRLTASELVAALGGCWYGQNGLAFCPAHENRRTPALSICVGEKGKVLLHCFAGCAYRDIIKALDTLGHEVPGPRPILQVSHASQERTSLAERRARQARQIWDAAVPLSNTLAERYLRERGIRTKLAGSLRYNPRCWHGQSAQRLPAMIGRIDGATGFAIHRTYLSPDGTGKASVTPAKMMLGRSAGGAVHLGERIADGPLLVAEGIETALSLAEGVIAPCGQIWAALSASGMAKLALPQTAGELIVAMDGDTAGRTAGHDLAQRADALGWQVSLLDAPDGQDWNDVLVSGGVNQ